jgi:hypothetical protein
MSGLNLSDVAKLPILLPPKPEREKIEAIVGALDRKIELNRRMNETLEALARAISRAASSAASALATRLSAASSPTSLEPTEG